MNKKSILLVDDNLMVLRNLSKLLEKHDFKTISLRSAEEAIEFLINNIDIELDLIITDYQMLSINGLEFAESIKNDLNYKDIPIILYTQLPNISIGGRFDIFNKIIYKTSDIQTLLKEIKLFVK
ncbi:MAG: CheY-like chemotaxis protein [Candidatus Midichloriaceae bacterium]|jgi:CheY-like chemotaxis protein